LTLLTFPFLCDHEDEGDVGHDFLREKKNNSKTEENESRLCFRFYLRFVTEQ
jgi:hypothetical protein